MLKNALLRTLFEPAPMGYRTHLPAPSSTPAGQEQQMADLYSLVYVSTATRLLAMDDIDRLLEKARQRNLDQDVTGVLLYSDGNFMQCLEGPAARLASVFETIKADSLHFGIIDLVREPIKSREFSEWSMAFRVAGASGASSPAYQDELLSERLSLSGEPMSLSRGLLAKFWSRGRTSVVPSLIELSKNQMRRPRPGGVSPRLTS